MISLSLFAASVALGIGLLILWLIRRDRLPISHSIWWLAIAVMIGVFGFEPNLIDRMAHAVGVDYPPSLLFTLAILVLLLKALHEDLEVSTTRRRLLRLAQKVAMLEQELERARAASDSSDQPPPR